jgi:transposase
MPNGSYHRFNRAGRAGRRGFVGNRHGTLSLYAALDTQSGKVLGKTAARHTSQEFVEFLTGVVERRPRGRSTSFWTICRRTTVRWFADFLATHPNVHFHFTPTYSSWLNQVEIWFSKVERDVIARGIFTSVKDLARKLRRYINAYSANAKPIQWKYSDPTRRIRSNVVSATCR